MLYVSYIPCIPDQHQDTKAICLDGTNKRKVKMSFILSSHAFVFSFIWLCTAFASQENWEGVWPDQIWGEKIHVCVSTVGSEYYGQATFSKIGYMRGKIDSSDVWSGNFYLQGLSAPRGTFSLTLSTGSPNSFSGDWTLDGYDESFTTTSVQQEGTTTPDDSVCFRTDDDLLTSSEEYYLSGNYLHSSNNVYIFYADSQYRYCSYYYEWNTGFEYGYIQGPTFENGQVGPNQWYESGSTQGIEMFVAKNKTAVYYMWWTAESLAAWDGPDGTQGNSMSMIYKTSLPNTDYNEYMCYAFESAFQENLCFGAPIADNDDVIKSNTITSVSGIMAFGTIQTVLLLVILYFAYIRKFQFIQGNHSSSNPMSNKENL